MTKSAVHPCRSVTSIKLQSESVIEKFSFCAVNILTKILTNTYLYDYILLIEERNNLRFFFKPVNHELQSVYFKVFYHESFIFSSALKCINQFKKHTTD